MREVDRVDPRKVADVVFEVLTGLAKDLPGRELHRLRERHGTSPYLVRPADGATAWRVALQVNSPGARRLHLWVLPGGRIDLSRVGVHNDVRP